MTEGIWVLFMLASWVIAAVIGCSTLDRKGSDIVRYLRTGVVVSLFIFSFFCFSRAASPEWRDINPAPGYVNNCLDNGGDPEYTVNSNGDITHYLGCLERNK